MAMAALRSCVMSRIIRSGVSRQLRVFDTKAKRRWEFVMGDDEWWEYSKRRGRGELDDDDEEVYYKDFPNGKLGDLVVSDEDPERTIEDDIFDDMCATEDFGDVDDEERKELVRDFLHYFEHVDIVPPDMTLRRGSIKEIGNGVYVRRRKRKLNGSFYERI